MKYATANAHIHEVMLPRSKRKRWPSTSYASYEIRSWSGSGVYDVWKHKHGRWEKLMESFTSLDAAQAAAQEWTRGAADELVWAYHVAGGKIEVWRGQLPIGV